MSRKIGPRRSHRFVGKRPEPPAAIRSPGRSRWAVSGAAETTAKVGRANMHMYEHQLTECDRAIAQARRILQGDKSAAAGFGALKGRVLGERRDSLVGLSAFGRDEWNVSDIGVGLYMRGSWPNERLASLTADVLDRLLARRKVLVTLLNSDKSRLGSVTERKDEGSSPTTSRSDSVVLAEVSTAKMKVGTERATGGSDVVAPKIEKPVGANSPARHVIEIVVGPSAVSINELGVARPLERTTGVDLLLILCSEPGKELGPIELRGRQARRSHAGDKSDEFGADSDDRRGSQFGTEVDESQRRAITRLFSRIESAKETRNGAEISHCQQELSAYLGSNGLRQTKMGRIVADEHPVRRSEQNAVGKAVRIAIEAIEQVAPVAGAHLRKNIHLSEYGNLYGPLPPEDRVVIRFA